MPHRAFRTTRDIRNLQGRPGWYRISNQAAGPAQVTIYDEIGFLGVPADQFMADLAAIAGDVELHLNSPGGDVHAGIAIYNQLKQRPGAVSVVVDGLAASAASFIAQAASPGRLAMAPHSQMMIHNGFGMTIGDADDMEQMAALLRKTTANIAGIYADRSGKPADYWLGKMAAETWYDDHEAVAEGLADHILGQEPPAGRSWNLGVYRLLRNADGNHAPMTGTHTHSHPAYGSQDGDSTHSHEHSHDGDASHGHSHDPDNDGDDDTTAAGDTDHDYVLPDGSPGPKAAWYTQILNEKYSADDRKRMAGNGHAMPDGSYPIEDEEDLGNAIRAVGRGGADHDAIRRHVIKRAKALGKSDAIPDNWNADGSLKTSADNVSEEQVLALFVRELAQLDAGKE